MVKNKIDYISMIAFAVVGLIICLFVGKKILNFDNTAEIKGEYLYWKDTKFIPCCGKYTEGSTIARTKDRIQINAVKEDSTNTFVVLRSFLDQYLVVREDYEISVSGEITTAFWGDDEISSTEFYHAVN